MIDYLDIKKLFKLKIFFIMKFNIKFLLILFMINKVKNECNITHPIYLLSENKCVSQY